MAFYDYGGAETRAWLVPQQPQRGQPTPDPLGLWRRQLGLAQSVVEDDGSKGRAALRDSSLGGCMSWSDSDP